MARLWLYITLLSSYLLLNVSGVPDIVDPVKHEKHKKACTMELKSCSINMPSPKLQPGRKGDKGEMGKKGDKGDQGNPGNKGKIGIPGDRGLDGSKRIRGPDGKPGDKGDIGPPGPQGILGPKGPHGVDGPKGEKGNTGKGSKGSIGERGSQGSQGPVGRDGAHGSYPCIYPSVAEPECEASSIDDPDDIDLDTTLDTVCKHVPAFGVLGTSEKVVLMRPEHKIKVTCVVKSKSEILTCIKPEEEKVDIIFSSGDTGSWLSEKLNIDKLYGLTREQIEWFQRNSNSASQTIKYHSNSSNLLNSTDENKTLLMLSWNDVTFGPNPSETTPFTYKHINTTVNTETGYTENIIEIKSDSVERLPVVDFYIGDVGGEAKNIMIENLELCFN